MSAIATTKTADLADFDILDTYEEQLADDPAYEAWANHIEDIDAYLDAAYAEQVSAGEADDLQAAA